MATKVTTLKNAEKTDNLLPRTELNAIFDSDGNYLDNELKASDLNALKGGAVDELVRFTEDGAGTPIPTDADTLEGHDASYFATADALSSLSGKVITPPNMLTSQSYSTVSSLEITAPYNCWARLTSNNETADLVHKATKDGAVIDYLWSFKTSWFPLLKDEKITIYGTNSYGTICVIFPMQ